MDFKANYNSPVDMRIFRISTFSAAPSNVSYASKSTISIIEPYQSYYGNFSYARSKGKASLDWDRSTLTGFSNDSFSARGFSLPGKQYLRLAKDKNGTAISQYVLKGNDSITGSRYSDVLTGLEGNDRLDGGMGADTLIGGAGADTFVLTNWGNDPGAFDTVIDFSPSEGDRLLHSGFDRAVAPVVTRVASGVEVRLPTGIYGTGVQQYAQPFVLSGLDVFDVNWVDT